MILDAPYGWEREDKGTGGPGEKGTGTRDPYLFFISRQEEENANSRSPGPLVPRSPCPPVRYPKKKQFALVFQALLRYI